MVCSPGNPDTPRFKIHSIGDQGEDDQVFRDGNCIYNQRIGRIYSAEDIVELLNKPSARTYKRKVDRIIKNAIETERTYIGKSVLTQLAELLDVEL